MTIFRSEHKKNYTVVNNYVTTDKRLSWKAKGIWLYAFSRPNDWEFHIEDLIKQSTDGRDSVRAGLKELMDAGYLHKVQKREYNKFSSAEWVFYEEPRELKESLPQTGFPSTGNQSTENHPLLSTEIPSTEKQQHPPPPQRPPDKEDVVVVFSKSEEGRKLSEWMIQLGFNFLDIAAIFRECQKAQRIREVVTYAVEKAKLSNPTGWVISAIRHCYDLSGEIKCEAQRKIDKNEEESEKMQRRRGVMRCYAQKYWEKIKEVFFRNGLSWDHRSSEKLTMGDNAISWNTAAFEEKVKKILNQYKMPALEF